jgi:hypothetical protein
MFTHRLTSMTCCLVGRKTLRGSRVFITLHRQCFRPANPTKSPPSHQRLSLSRLRLFLRCMASKIMAFLTIIPSKKYSRRPAQPRLRNPMVCHGGSPAFRFALTGMEGSNEMEATTLARGWKPEGIAKSESPYLVISTGARTIRDGVQELLQAGKLDDSTR